MLNVCLAEPRGFCAGVRRAVAIVEDALKKYGPPVYVRHEIVHNRHVIKTLEEQGAVFVGELEEADISRPLIFSAHGVAAAVVSRAREMGFGILIDATCPLVDKVDRQIRKYAENNMNIAVIGKTEHPEIIGTVGQLSDTSKVRIIKSVLEAADLPFNSDEPLGFVTQTTLSVDETREIVSALHKKYPLLSGLKKDDICYATTNRQIAVREVAARSRIVVIIGSKNSSNSRQLREVALKNGAGQAFLIDDVSEFPWAELREDDTLGISAGASAPEYLVTDLLSALHQRYNNINVHDVIITRENVAFKR